MRLAAANGLDLRTFKGSGLNGRVTRKDVRGEIRVREAKTASNANEQAKTILGTDIVSPRPVRTAAGKDSATMLVEADVTNLVQLLRKHEEGFSRKEGVKLTYVPFYLKAVVNGLKECPAMNAVWEAGSIAMKKEIHITLVSDTGVSTVMEHADGRSVAGFAIELGRETNGKSCVNPRQAADRSGTFALHAAGSDGAVTAHPSIPDSHTAVLYIGPVVQRPVIKQDTIGGRSIVHLCLTLNQQAAGHSVCTAFLNSVKQTLERYDSSTLLY
ncbi:2-oxo acid dehydrogenase subunit E2 [Paenibacillus spongiae]|uniref:2-oxo acid dehydrogenase subunit E2 n=1 Tax=Paenibacillus spongiae TaxID=2909671 RepID=A0ABY5SI55_9BACL|nr:2-oxo acid dehydrogenase subunit E2 [Paenibacillus spongiae]UVI33631.1 2-oxo acid dehydrogenase subunit E2 [Paenibacillus spongiae]